jgi:hypothetical protein
MSKDFTAARHAVCKAILNDPDIQAFMATNFSGKTLKAFRETPPGFTPGEDDLPCIGFGVSTHNRSDKDLNVMEHVAPLGIYLSRLDAVQEADGDGVICVDAVTLLDELGGLIEPVASRALLDGGWPFDQDPYLPDDVDWTQFFMSFRLYRVREQSIL